MENEKCYSTPELRFLEASEMPEVGDLIIAHLIDSRSPNGIWNDVGYVKRIEIRQGQSGTFSPIYHIHFPTMAGDTWTNFWVKEMLFDSKDKDIDYWELIK